LALIGPRVIPVIFPLNMLSRAFFIDQKPRSRRD
jgi:hypothetical protein